MLRDSAARYLLDNYDFEKRQKIAKERDGFDPEVWQTFAEMGWLAMPLPEAAGGFDSGATEVMLLCEQMGRHLVLEPYLETVVVTGGLLKAATAGYQERYLPAIAEGSLQGALAHGEPNKHRSLANVETRAVRVEGGFELSGSKAVVLNGSAADLFIVSARTSGQPGDIGGVTLFAVPADAKGLTRRDYRTYDDRRACDLSISGVVVPSEAVVGDLDNADGTLGPASDMAQLAACAEAVGAMDALLEATVNYTKQRIQFGQALSQFQVLRHRMVDMYIHTELARSLLLASAALLDEGAEEAPRLVSALKARTVKAGRFVSQNAVQLHGGIAMTDELKVGHYFKRLTMLESFFGNRDYHIQCFIEADKAAASALADATHRPPTAA